jgi:GNAT superfamily N-acetyltransferase
MSLMSTSTPYPQGFQLDVRPARLGDLTELEELVHRCSDETTYRRFHGATGHAVRRELQRIASPVPEHQSWVATDGIAIHGTATLATGSDGTVEAAFLVEDDWSRRGVGRALFDEVAREACRRGIDHVTAWVQADNQRARRFLRAMVPAARTTFAGSGELEIDLPVVQADACASGSSISDPSVEYRESA